MEKSQGQKMFEILNNGLVVNSSNDIIDEAIDALFDQQSIAAWSHLEECIRIRMEHGASLIIPGLKKLDSVKNEGINESGLVDIGRTVSPDRGTAKDGIYFDTFTNVDALERTEEIVALSAGIQKAFEFALTKNMTGIRMQSGRNKKPIYLDRERILSILKSYYDARYRVYVAKDNILKYDVDAIVNPTDRYYSGSGGLDKAIHRAAGRELENECVKLPNCKTGEAHITDAYRLNARRVIHTVGPRYSADQDVSDLLASCYIKALELAKDNNLHSIAFPAISTGEFGYPKEKAGKIATKTIINWLDDNYNYPLRVFLIARDDENIDVYNRYTGRYEGMKFIG